MARTTKDPAARVAASANRALGIVFTDAGQDTIATATNSSPTNSSPAAHWVASRFGLNPLRAALVASLSGLGTAAVPLLPAILNGGSQ